jgi:hypothetical protein
MTRSFSPACVVSRFPYCPASPTVTLEDICFADLSRDCRDLSILLPLVDIRDSDEDESFDKDGAFLEEGDIT